MFSALIKAFTGRAGFLASLLAFILIGLTAVAVLSKLPRIEQNLVDSSQSVLNQYLADNDTLVSLRAEGRNLILDGEFSDAPGLAAKLEDIEGVRSVIINGSTPAPQASSQEPAEVVAVQVDSEPVADSAGQDTNAPDSNSSASDSGETQVEAESMEAMGSGSEELVATGEPLVQAVPEPLKSDVAASADSDVAEKMDQSSLSLRYDGTRLSLSGHLADEQMAQLIAEEVSNAIPGNSEMEINVDGQGAASPLNWMNEFLETVAGLPDDAQGLIEGSDKQGVQVIADAEQTLLRRAQPQAMNTEQADGLVPGSRENDSVTEEEGSQLEVSALQAQTESAEIVPEAEQPDSVQVAGASADLAIDSSVSMENVIEVPVSGPVENTPADMEKVVPVHPGKYIVDLNNRIAGQAVFEAGKYFISDALAAELDDLAEMMLKNPNLLLRVVGNIDFSVDPRIAEYVGIDRAREIRNYLHAQRVERFRVFATPLPRDYAFDKQVQVVFYISE
jgi:outer membrane protein OmpA-like peptidoglycan-associated protein